MEREMKSWAADYNLTFVERTLLTAFERLEEEVSEIRKRVNGLDSRFLSFDGQRTEPTDLPNLGNPTRDRRNAKQESVDDDQEGCAHIPKFICFARGSSGLWEIYCGRCSKILTANSKPT